MKYTLSDYPATFISSLMNDVVNVLDTVNPVDAQVPMNVKEGAESFTVEVVVPGITKENIDISVKENKLIVSYKHTSEENEEVKYLKREFSKKDFERTFTLPNNINLDEIKASYDEGILSVLLPKNVSLEKKKIEIS
ncbi:Hsp20/alpha crystallin family protein [Flammeovirga kamogawensis]|uniref:Hsp20/alpha crystallin family protein n=1 Tax=Flammeovirga kamogawensis TaxID=373891 RepID=A0ABX8GSK6_9BACT|nr:Hsp20/alpha crystallin family protein [Flammeovirga kamogawensis]MBB6461489.1 HSP20 family protein [Flammeovirga kamogawensis]QWG06381.1 Hsp20/alpha crystallin family protein [Flammeovirga kamogawensis]TRX68210.1 Hsp20/alpha crystallin family protein [Flammeovirga kamogawensis]